MKNILLLTALSVSVASFLVSATTKEEDQYAYIDTPVKEQPSDLLDDDSDGVINARDLCTTTPEGSELDNDGCEYFIDSAQTLGLRILFTNNSYFINPVFKTQISNMASFLDEFPETSIELQGFASKVGQADKNLILSENRANAVRSELLKNGVEENRVTIVGFGDTVLDEKGSDEFSHAMNRKVVATVIGYKGEVKKEWTIFTKIGK
ncbi:OmpA family protein [Vibrio sp. ZSDZ34]|jgi:outer membrane protein OmpA-like peptidoglycan-associated protein|uniref:OmpA family protein n=1 Tax=Vibrio gelatinilyticus TaxID=2893468 RepID=A0A9X2AV74_9VIBR|nr:OmpA family protein [Vibrio gelatinilyticus]MCJ2376644.1 OmpA family protein [Vibrio gelatinilyticus]